MGGLEQSTFFPDQNHSSFRNKEQGRWDSYRLNICTAPSAGIISSGGKEMFVCTQPKLKHAGVPLCILNIYTKIGIVKTKPRRELESPGVSVHFILKYEVKHSILLIENTFYYILASKLQPQELWNNWFVSSPLFFFKQWDC